MSQEVLLDIWLEEIVYFRLKGRVCLDYEPYKSSE